MNHDLFSARRRGAERGTAMVEFALTAPLLVTILLFSIFITDLVRVKLKLQEASRYVTWEMTSYVLTDFGNGDHAAAFDQAMNKTVAEAQEMYKDLDSVEDSAGSGQVFDYEPMTVQVRNLDAPLLNQSLGGGGGFFGTLLSALNGGLNTGLNLWGFNTKGRVEADVTMKVNNKFLNKNFYNSPGDGMFTVDQHGGTDLSSLTMKSRLTMTASGWHLPDGADQTVQQRSNMAGDHNSDNDGKPGGLYLQVNRMTYGGAKDGLDRMVPFIADLLQWLPLPHFFGTYVVSHNYMESPDPAHPERTAGNRANNCNVTNVRPGGYNGFHNMAADTDTNDSDHPPLFKDHGDKDELMRCFDTAPFRESNSYGSDGHSDSLYARVYAARGANFMGCQNPMADDPTRNAVYGNDESRNKEVCSNNAP